MPFDPTARLGLGTIEAPPQMAASQQPAFLNEIYDERFLYIPDADWDPATTSYQGLRDYVDQNLPLVNRLLVQVMIYDSSERATRYPGAIVENKTTGHRTVLIPWMSYGNDGSEAILRWVAPVEEIRIDHDQDGSTPDVGPFSVVKPSGFANSGVEGAFIPGMAAIRINYPAQSAALINRSAGAGSMFVANDATLSDQGLDADQSNYQLVTPINDGIGANSGRYGLGRHVIHVEGMDQINQYGVRPYRKVLSAQAIYRREVFE